MSAKRAQKLFPARFMLVVGLMGVGVGVLLWRAVDLHVLDHDFLKGQGDARHLRVVSVPAHRGKILDRNGEPLAISTPVESVWANPQELDDARERWPQLAAALGLNAGEMRRMLDERLDREFVYLRRHVTPELGQRVLELGLPGVSLQREYRRYYPTGEVFAHVIGFTNIDDAGQEGLERHFDERLRGQPGQKRVLKDRLGRVIKNVESISQPRPGRDVRLSLDRRVQYLAYRELKAAVKRNNAKGGSLVVLDVDTGEVVAMVNQPSYNPNNRGAYPVSAYRNRAVTDQFEAGSTIKPFTVAAGLESGEYRPDTPVDTTPGLLRVGSDTVRDVHNYGLIDVARVIKKSSNVGASKIALSLDGEQLWDVFHRVGFGQSPRSGFPGEASGRLRYPDEWRQIEQATMAFGYGLSVSTLQLAHAYTVVAGDGRLRPVSFTPVEDRVVRGRRAIGAQTAAEVRRMLQAVVGPGGTGTRAAVEGYRVAGKTGTVRKVGADGYQDDRYRALFAGMAPASDPRLVMVVVIDEPRGEKYYGGLVAAPVFSRVMAGALRLLDIPPDDLPRGEQRLAAGLPRSAGEGAL